jgi:hypothetical protein
MPRHLPAMPQVRFPEDVWERIKFLRPRCSPTAMRMLDLLDTSDGDSVQLPIRAVCETCKRRILPVCLVPRTGKMHRGSECLTCSEDYCAFM